MIIKKCALAIAFIFAILLSGCSEEETEAPEPKYFDLNEVAKYPHTGYKETDITKTCLKVGKYDIPLPEGAGCGAFCVYGDNVYYSVQYIGLIHIGVEFKEEYNTSIWCYRTDTKENELIYQYDLDYCVDIFDMKCNGNVLVWSEWHRYNSCRVKYFDLQNIDEPVEIITEGEGSLSEINMMLSYDSVYWVEEVNGEKGKYNINRYSFTDEKVYREEESVPLAAPYKEMCMCEGMYAVCESDESGKYSIVIHNTAKGTEEVVEVSEAIDILACNSRFCIGKPDTSYSDCIYVYNIEYKQMIKMEMEKFNQCVLMDNMVIVSAEAGVTAYNLDKKEKTLLATDTGYSIYSGNDNNAYIAMNNTGLSEMNILNITMGAMIEKPTEETTEKPTEKPFDNSKYDKSKINILEWEEYIEDPNDRYETTMFRPQKISVEGVEYTYTYTDNNRLLSIAGSDGTDIQLEHNPESDCYIREYKNGRNIKYIKKPSDIPVVGRSFEIIGFEHDGNIYTYRYDIFNRISGIMDKDGVIVAKYKYVGLEKCTSIEVTNCTEDNIGDVNSLRYEGHYVDEATGFSFYFANIYNVMNMENVDLIEMFDPMR